jgi:hypothetical protein
MADKRSICPVGRVRLMTYFPPRLPPYHSRFLSQYVEITRLSGYTGSVSLEGRRIPDSSVRP